MQMPRSLVVVGLAAVLALAMLGSAHAVMGARAIGMGGAFVGLADDASATYWNPGALAFQPEAAFTYTAALSNRDEAVARDFLAYVTPFDENSTVGISYARSTVAAISAYEFTLNWDQTWWWFSYGYRVSPQTGVGFNVRWVDDGVEATEDGEPLNVATDSDLGIDLAVYHEVSGDVSVGLLIQDANEPSSSVTLPDLSRLELARGRTFSPGIAWKRPAQNVTWVAEIYDLGDTVERGFRVGVEKCVTKAGYTGALRAGYCGDAGAVTVGAGVVFSGWTIDLAYGSGDFDGTWYGSITGGF